MGVAAAAIATIIARAYRPFCFIYGNTRQLPHSDQKWFCPRRQVYLDTQGSSHGTYVIHHLSLDQPVLQTSINALDRSSSIAPNFWTVLRSSAYICRGNCSGNDDLHSAKLRCQQYPHRIAKGDSFVQGSPFIGVWGDDFWSYPILLSHSKRTHLWIERPFLLDNAALYHHRSHSMCR